MVAHPILTSHMYTWVRSPKGKEAVVFYSTRPSLASAQGLVCICKTKEPNHGSKNGSASNLDPAGQSAANAVQSCLSSKSGPPPVLTILSRCAWEVESDRKFLGSGVTLPIPNRDAGTINVSSIKRLEEAAIRNFQ